MTVAVIFLDIDNFKALNTAHSETVIDEKLLPDFQRFLESSVRHRGCAYRQGGEEFVIILPNHTRDEGVAFAERLRTDTEGRVFKVRSEDVRITISVGIAFFPKDGSSFNEVIHAANLAEHRAKAAGKNCLVIANTEGSD